MLATLAHADAAALQSCFQSLTEVPDWSFVRSPETGLVMVRGRVGGDGGAFNLGEVTVTRAAVALETGETGFAYALGRDRAKAERSAIIHALWKRSDRRVEIEETILQPLRAQQEAEDRKVREEVAPTKVDFYTLVRGED